MYKERDERKGEGSMVMAFFPLTTPHASFVPQIGQTCAPSVMRQKNSRLPAC